MTSAAVDVPRPQDRVITRPVKRDWAKWGLAAYFVLFLVFLYGPMIVMAILSLQGYYGGVTFPFKGPLSLDWWRSLINSTVSGTPTHAGEIHTAAKNSLFLSLAAGAIVSVLAFTLSMAFRRRWRFRSDAAMFYVIMLALMTPGFLLAVGTQLFWSYMGLHASIWHTALGANVIWGIPFGFLVMLAVWNRYDPRVEEAARDLGGNWWRTFVAVILPQTLPGIVIGSIFIFVLTMGEYGTVLVVGQNYVQSVGTIVNSYIVGAVQYPQGAAAAVLLVLALIAGVFVITRFSNLREDL